MSTVLELLRVAAESGQRVTIVYNGGSFPGQPRPILPIQVGTETVLAREPGLPREKSFKIAKIATVTLLDGTSASNALALPVQSTQSPIPRHSSLDGYADYLRPIYESQGWHFYHRTEDAWFGVAGPLKSGKAPKYPKIRIAYTDRTIEHFLDPETGELATRTRELTGRERPWRVESHLQPQAKAFAELHVAIEFLAAEVAAAHPAPAG